MRKCFFLNWSRRVSAIVESWHTWLIRSQSWTLSFIWHFQYRNDNFASFKKKKKLMRVLVTWSQIIPQLNCIRCSVLIYWSLLEISTYLENTIIKLVILFTFSFYPSKHRHCIVYMVSLIAKRKGKWVNSSIFAHSF